MIVDWFLGLVFGIVTAIVGLFPDGDSFLGAAAQGTGGWLWDLASLGNFMGQWLPWSTWLGWISMYLGFEGLMALVAGVVFLYNKIRGAG